MKKSFYLALILLSGCASVFSGRHQKIRLKVVDAETGQILNNALVMATEHNGKQHQGRGNVKFEVTRSDGAITVSGAHPGYKAVIGELDSRLNRIVYFNQLAGVFAPGAIGFDCMTRATNEMPNIYVLYMQKED